MAFGLKIEGVIKKDGLVINTRNGRWSMSPHISNHQYSQQIRPVLPGAQQEVEEEEEEDSI